MVAEERIAYIQKRQELLASAVSDMQASFFATILKSIDKVARNVAELDRLFYQFTRGELAAVISQFASDIMSIGRVNESYFKTLLGKEYTLTKDSIQEPLRKRFGLTENGFAKDSFFDLLVRDTSVQQQVKKAAYQLQYTGKGPKEFAETINGLLEGKAGAYQRFFSTFVYDTYQQADAEIQEQTAKRLELEAALYSGGTVRDSRPFCKERNGKVWLRSEIAAWNEETWAGKIKEGSVEINRGGYNCRHHLSWITNKQAINRRSDLIINEKGNLQIKS